MNLVSLVTSCLAGDLATCWMLEHQIVPGKVRRTGRPVPGGDGGGHPHQELRHHRQRGRVLLLGAEHPHLAKITLTHLFDPRSLLLIMSSEIRRKILFISAYHLLAVVPCHHNLGVRGVHAERVAVHRPRPCTHISNIFVDRDTNIFCTDRCSASSGT